MDICTRSKKEEMFQNNLAERSAHTSIPCKPNYLRKQVTLVLLKVAVTAQLICNIICFVIKVDICYVM